MQVDDAPMTTFEPPVDPFVVPPLVQEPPQIVEQEPVIVDTFPAMQVQIERPPIISTNQRLFLIFERNRHYHQRSRNHHHFRGQKRIEQNIFPDDEQSHQESASFARHQKQ